MKSRLNILGRSLVWTALLTLFAGGCYGFVLLAAAYPMPVFCTYMGAAVMLSIIVTFNIDW